MTSPFISPFLLISQLISPLLLLTFFLDCFHLSLIYHCVGWLVFFVSIKFLVELWGVMAGLHFRLSFNFLYIVSLSLSVSSLDHEYYSNVTVSPVWIGNGSPTSIVVSSSSMLFSSSWLAYIFDSLLTFSLSSHTLVSMMVYHFSHPYLSLCRPLITYLCRPLIMSTTLANVTVSPVPNGNLVTNFNRSFFNHSICVVSCYYWCEWKYRPSLACWLAG